MPVTGATTATLAPPGVYQAPFQAYTPDLQVPIITGVPKVARECRDNIADHQQQRQEMYATITQLH